MSTAEMDLASASGETDFVSVKSKKGKSRKRKLDTTQETSEASTTQTNEMDTGESQPSAVKRPNFPPISGDKLRVIEFLFEVTHITKEISANIYVLVELSILRRHLD